MKTVFLLVMVICTGTGKKQVTIEDEGGRLFKKAVLQDLFDNEHAKLRDMLEALRGPEQLSLETRNNNRAETFTRETSPRPSMLCVICQSAIATFMETIADDRTEDEMIDTFATLCTAMRIQSYNVCRGVVELNLPIINYVIRNTPEGTPRTYCGIVTQIAGDPDFCPYDDPRFEWQVELPERPEPETIPIIETDSNPLKVAVLTDAHIDPLYEAFGVGDCGEPTCCRKGQTPARTYSDSRQAEPAGYWGDYRNCDSPIWAFDDVIERIGEIHKDIDVVYYIGDTIDHGVWETSYELINKINRYLVEKMRSTFGEQVLIVPVIGNHESQPTNQFAPEYVTEEKFNTTWLYKAMENKWDYYIPEEARESFLARGEFSRLVRPGLRVISINNNVAYKYNWWIVFDPLDAKRHLDWLVEELRKAELNGERVHILAHLPPGTHDLTESWTIQYNKIVNRFSSTIAAEFNGHIHSDEFKIFYSLTDDRPINVAWGSGSATAYTHYNLNYKIVEFNTETFVPERITNFVYNVTEANLTPHRRPHWFQLYEMKSTFELNDLSSTSMNELVYKMTNETRFLDLYSAFSSKLSDNRWPQCDEGCKLNNLCKTVTTVLWVRQKCEELLGLYYQRL